MQQAPDEPQESLDSKSLLADRSFWGIAVTQFLGAFNDNLYKQLMLLMAIGGIGAINKDDRQGWATLAFWAASMKTFLSASLSLFIRRGEVISKAGEYT